MFRSTLRRMCGTAGGATTGVKLAHFPHTGLTAPAAAVYAEDRSRPQFTQQVQNLIAAAHKLNVMSLSAPKVSWDAQVILLKATPDEEEFEVFVNPVVPGYDDRTSVAPMCGMWENCASCGAVHAWVVRPQQITVSYTDEWGADHTEVMDGMRARLFMHELDHLRGVSMLQQVFSTDFIVSVTALNQRQLWPHNFPSAEARMTGMSEMFDYVRNQVVVPKGLEWVSRLGHNFAEFNARRIAESRPANQR
jgi:peptide deformylase